MSRVISLRPMIRRIRPPWGWMDMGMGTGLWTVIRQVIRQVICILDISECACRLELCRIFLLYQLQLGKQVRAKAEWGTCTWESGSTLHIYLYSTQVESSERPSPINIHSNSDTSHVSTELLMATVSIREQEIDIPRIWNPFFSSYTKHSPSRNTYMALAHNRPWRPLGKQRAGTK